MQVLKDEFERVSHKYRPQELYLDGFSPEQIYYQMEQLCSDVLERCRRGVDRLYPFYERMEDVSANEKFCHHGIAEDNHQPAGHSDGTKYFEQYSDTSGSDEPEGESVHGSEVLSEEDPGDESSSSNGSGEASSGDFDVSDGEVLQMPAEDVMKLLTAKVKKNPDLYVSDESESVSEEDRSP